MENNGYVILEVVNLFNLKMSLDKPDLINVGVVLNMPNVEISKDTPILSIPKLFDIIGKTYQPQLEYTDDGTYIIVTHEGTTLFKHRKSDEYTLLSAGIDTDTTL